MSSLLVAAARLGGNPVDVVVDDGRISAITPAGESATEPTVPVLDGAGLLVLPTLVDAHTHPDKSTWGGPWVSREPARSLADLIDNDVRLQKKLDRSVLERTLGLFRRYVAHGARGLRAHADVSPEHGLDNLLGVKAAADRVSAALDVQIVAFPQLGVSRTPGTAELLREALVAGASHIGGLDPGGIDGDLHGQLDIVFGLAAEFGAGLDIHLHDGGHLGRLQMEEIIRRTEDAGLAGKVNIGHAFCFADFEGAELDALAEATASAGISLATCALGFDPLIPVAALREAGVRVALGSDGIRDAWTPFGNADMLHRTHLLAYRTDAATDEALEACLEVAAHEGADLLGLERSDLTVGSPADFMLLPAQTAAQAVVDHPTPTWVIRGGRVVAHEGVMVPTAPYAVHEQEAH